jgi:NTP pyrophosphatase (non-canonical NTP hydrolase)
MLLKNLIDMEVKEYQKLIAEIVNKIDKKHNVERTSQLNISQLVEELGELAKEVNRENLRNEKPEKKDLEDEFADVLILLIKLADHFDVDIEKAVLDKIEVLKKRHNLE